MVRIHLSAGVIRTNREYSGEDTVSLTGECNPNYTDIEKYKTQVVEVLKRTAQALEQSTTQLTIIEADFVYLDFRERERK